MIGSDVESRVAGFFFASLLLASVVPTADVSAQVVPSPVNATARTHREGDAEAAVLRASPADDRLVTLDGHLDEAHGRADEGRERASAPATIPPTMGAAIRFITLAPAPVPQRIGSNPAVMAATVIILGRRIKGSSRPSMGRVRGFAPSSMVLHGRRSTLSLSCHGRYGPN
jgi:hypothetical protein